MSVATEPFSADSVSQVFCRRCSVYSPKVVRPVRVSVTGAPVTVLSSAASGEVASDAFSREVTTTAGTTAATTADISAPCPPEPRGEDLLMTAMTSAAVATVQKVLRRLPGESLSSCRAV